MKNSFQTLSIPDLLVGAERSELVMTQSSCGHVVACTLLASTGNNLLSRQSKLNAPHAPRLLVLYFVLNKTRT